MKVLILTNNDDDLLTVTAIFDDEVEDAIRKIEEVAPDVNISINDPETLEDTIIYFREMTDE